MLGMPSAPPNSPHGSEPPKPKVLIVDDDRQWILICTRWLTMAGFDVVSHMSAIGTSRAIVEHHPHVVLLDVCMDGLTGDELARLLKKNRATRNTPVILHSGLSREELEPKIMQTGALGAIRKTGSGAQFFTEFYRLLNKVGIQIPAA